MKKMRKEYFFSGLVINFVINRVFIKLILCDIKVIRFVKKEKKNR